MFWHKECETMPRRDMQALQLERMRNTLRHAYANVPFYKESFDKYGLDSENLGCLEDIKNFPFTYKSDLRDNYPYGMFAVPLKEVVRIHSSSGTTGKPTVVGYNRHDLDLWQDMVARLLTMGGLTCGDIIQISFTYGLFTGGFGLHAGAERIGASVIPVSSGNSSRQIMIMKDYRTTALVSTPSYALRIAEVMKEEGYKKEDLFLKFGFFGSEPWGEAVRQEIQDKLGIIATDNYGLSEIMGPGIAGECLEQNGMHINEDVYYPEIIDPETLEVLPEGETGELVLTTLNRQTMPMVRYRTRDITRIYTEKCPCGRTLIKMDKPRGRTDDMIIVNGVNVFPSQVEEALRQFAGVTPHYMIYLKKRGALDAMEIKIETVDTIFFDEMKRQKVFLENLTDKLASILQIKPKVLLVMPHTLERFTGKAKRVVDERFE